MKTETAKTTKTAKTAKPFGKKSGGVVKRSKIHKMNAKDVVAVMKTAPLSKSYKTEKWMGKRGYLKMEDVAATMKMLGEKDEKATPDFLQLRRTCLPFYNSMDKTRFVGEEVGKIVPKISPLWSHIGYLDGLARQSQGALTSGDVDSSAFMIRALLHETIKFSEQIADVYCDLQYLQKKGKERAKAAKATASKTE